MPAKPSADPWESLWHRIDSFAAALARSAATNVNALDLRQEARGIVQTYVREIRPSISLTDSAGAELESAMQRLITLSTGKNSKASYQKTLRALRQARKGIETGLEFLIQAESPAESKRPVQEAEAAIIRTLETMLPSASNSYRQVLADIEGRRISYRGTAAELRETVREVLDHLAPDADVMASPGFKLEPNQRGPTMKQKVRFILRARRVTDSSRQTAEDAVQHVDESVASVGRSVYTRGSVDVHTARPREEVMNFKMYADAVLAEMLQIHKA